MVKQNVRYIENVLSKTLTHLFTPEIKYGIILSASVTCKAEFILVFLVKGFCFSRIVTGSCVVLLRFFFKNKTRNRYSAIWSFRT